MDKSVTIKARSVLLAVVIVLAMAVAYLLGSAGDPPAQAVAAAEEKPRTIVMTGAGETTVVPDQVSFALTVTRTAGAMDRALASASKRLDQVVAALKEHGVEPEDVQSTELSMRPHYVRVKGEAPRLDGYRVVQSVRVTVPELADSGKAITAAVDAGGSSIRVNDIRLEVSDPEAALAKARDAAVEEATAKAKRYAEAAGESLGSVRAMREVGNGGRQVLEQAGFASARFDSTAALSLHAGESELAVNLEMTWELE